MSSNTKSSSNSPEALTMMDLWINHCTVHRQEFFYTGEDDSGNAMAGGGNQKMRRQQKTPKRFTSTIALMKMKTLVCPYKNLGEENNRQPYSILKSGRENNPKPDSLQSEELHSIRSLGTQVLGHGSYGIVFKIKYKHQDAALKLARHTSRAIQRSFKQERNVLELLQSAAGAPRILAYCQDPPAIIMEFIPGRTFKTYVQLKEISDINKLQMLPEIGRQLQELHQHNIIHVDFKADNIMLEEKPDEDIRSNNLRIRILDFGMAYPAGKFLRLHSNGTKWYAPEYFQDGGAPTSKSGDVYSFGYLIKYTLRRLKRAPPHTFSVVADGCMKPTPGHRLHLPTALETLEILVAKEIASSSNLAEWHFDGTRRGPTVCPYSTMITFITVAT
ncbi:hypothetical protein SK128_006573, partial [Halocaridina rubra]